MKNLLVITQKVDEDDQLLGFSVNWFRHFAKKFNLLVILCLEKGEFKLPANTRVISLGKDSGLNKFCQLFNFYKHVWQLRKHYDAVFVFMNAIWVVLGAWLWRILHKRVFLWYAHKTIKLKHRLAEKLADGIFTSTPEGFRIRSKKVMVVGQGVDTDLFQPKPKLKNQNSKFLKILSVGRIAAIKNYEVMLEALKILADEGVDFSVTIIGEPVYPEDFNYEKKLKDIVREAGLNQKISFLGKVSNKNLPSYYQSNDIFINLSKTGSLDKTILEAMACGLTVISSNEAAVKFLPPELRVGGDDPKELAEKIKKAPIQNFSEYLRQFVVQNHNLDGLVERISEVIVK